MFVFRTIAIILTGVIYRFQYIQASKDLHNFILSLESDGNESSFDENLEKLIGDFTELSTITEATNLVTILAVSIGIMQFFRYLSFDRKLGIVTETIFFVFFDLLPVLFIFITIVIAYGVLGTKIYGAQLRGNAITKLIYACVFLTASIFRVVHPR